MKYYYSVRIDYKEVRLAVVCQSSIRRLLRIIALNILHFSMPLIFQFTPEIFISGPIEICKSLQHFIFFSGRNFNQRT